MVVVTLGVIVQDWGQTLKLVRFVFCYKGHRYIGMKVSQQIVRFAFCYKGHIYIGMTLSQQIPIRLKLDH